MVGVLMVLLGVVGIVSPSLLIWMGHQFVTPTAWYVLAAVRVAIGVLLLQVARSSRSPRALRVVAWIPLLAGLAIPFIGPDRAREIVEQWSLQDAWLIRFSGIPVIALGAFIAYACAPIRRT